MGTCRRVAVLASIAVASVASAASAQVPLTEPAPSERARIAFSSDSELFTIAADGSSRTLLVPNGAEPAWSPDRTRIAFTRPEPDDDTGRPRVWTVAADGSDARRVTARGGSADEVAPTWSPDGQRLAFVRLRFDGSVLVSTIITAAATGGDERTIARLNARDFRAYSHLTWSPDGSRLLATRSHYFVDDGPDAEPELQSVRVADGRVTRLLRRAGHAAWSPDGARIAYVGLRPGCEADQCEEVYVANADGSGRRRLTTDEASDRTPSWSADGARIAFASNRNYPHSEQFEIYSIQPDGGCLTWLTNGTRRSYDPSWEPGAALSTDPGGCGAVPREPLIETDTSDVAAYTRAPVWWLGLRFGNLLLAEASVETGMAFLEYGDCAAYEPSECPSGFKLDSVPVCTTPVLLDVDPKRLARHQGALTAFPAFVEDGHPEIYAGTTMVAFEGFGTELIAPGVLEGLRRFGEDAPPAGGLPRAELPLRFWRTLEQTRARVRKYGSVAAVKRRFRISRETIERRLAIDRRLRKIGPLGRHDCNG